MEMIQEWVKNIITFIVALTFVEMIVPSGNLRPYIRYVFSLTIMASVVMPLSGLME